MEDKLKERITYGKRCEKCNHEEVYIMRDTNVNPMSDDDIHAAIKYKQQKLDDEFRYCEGCQFITRQKLIWFDY